MVLTGLFQFLLGISGGGQLIKFIPYPAVAGLVTGVGVLMVLSMLPPLAGDAGGLANPVTGAGINAAVVSGKAAGQAAAAWLAGQAHALDDYQEEMTDLFEAALDRAVLRRREILRCHEAGPGPTAAMLRRGWIAYPEYWAA